MKQLFILLGSLVIILIMYYRKVPLPLAIITGTVISGLAGGLNVFELTGTFFESLLSEQTVYLGLTVLLICLLGFILENVGSMDLMVQGANLLVKNKKIVLMLFPSLLGFLSVPGAAVFSAPLVDVAGERIGLTKEQKGAANILFRHMWYFVYPLYPGLIFTAQLFQISVYRIIFFLFPLLFLGQTASVAIIFKKSLIEKENSRENSAGFLSSLMLLLSSVSPIILILFLNLFLQADFLLSLLCGVIYSALFFTFKFPLGEKDKRNSFSFPAAVRMLKMIPGGINISLVLSTVAVMVYKDILDRSGIIQEVAGLFTSSEMPVILFVFFIPFLLALVSGSHMASLGLSIPLLLPLQGPGGSPLVMAGVVFASSFLGYLVSPVHLCFIVTQQYFKSSILGTLKLVFIPVIILATFLIILTMGWASRGFYVL